MGGTARSVIRLDQVGVAFGVQRRLRGEPYWALQDVSLELRSGQRLGVVGRNGAGKSTLLRVLAGILEPDRGRVERTVASCQLLSLSLGFVPYLSGRDNATLCGLRLGLRRREIDARLAAICDYAELGDFFEQPVASYSNGMVLRLGFAVALQAQPEVLLLDELLAVGDAEFQRKSAQAIHERINAGTTVVLVSHDEDKIADLCDSVLWIERGRSVMVGRCDEVLAAYRAAAR
ncbi:MAG TPA: ABC transporter ATP-binding protein [Tahibacter sp.]|nr:ABC transporter ATP-binding protein [Tahibacter sp.]HSX59918.1 ABC transporter ATP-binding protein [Tahibacter sp.]